MSITISSGLRSSVNLLADIGGQINISNNRLSTGKKINTAIENPNVYFLSKGLERESIDLKALLDNQNLAIGTLTKTLDALSGLIKYTNLIKSLIKQAQSLNNNDNNRNELGVLVCHTLNDIDHLCRDSSFNGTTILTAASTGVAFSAGTALNVITNTAATSTAQTTVKIDRIDTALNSGTSVFNVAGSSFLTFGWTGFDWIPTGGNTIGAGDGVLFIGGLWSGALGDFRLNTTLVAIDQALINLQTKASTIASSVSILQLRQSFTINSSRISSSAAENLIIADLNEEGANLTSLQTRQSFAVTSLQLAGQADKAILRLFG
jgi:flagellin